MTEKQEIMRTGADLPAVQADSPMAILRTAVEQGIDATSIEKLAELAWRQQDRDAAKQFAEALREFQNVCPPIVKNRHGGRATDAGSPAPYAFAALDVIERTVRPYLNDLGFSFTWDSTILDGMMSVTCTLKHINGHEEKSSFTCPADSANKGMPGQNKYAGANTFARRYTLTGVLGITTADADTDNFDVTTVNEEQARVLDQMCVETNTEEDRFFAWARADSFENVLASKYPEAIRFLEKKRARS